MLPVLWSSGHQRLLSASWSLYETCLPFGSLRSGWLSVPAFECGGWLHFCRQLKSVCVCVCVCVCAVCVRVRVCVCAWCVCVCVCLHSQGSRSLTCVLCIITRAHSKVRPALSKYDIPAHSSLTIEPWLVAQQSTTLPMTVAETTA